MNEITLRPYFKIENQDFQEKSIIKIKGKDFNNTKYQEGKSTFVIDSCNFNSLSIENSDNCKITDISIHFHSCLIKEIDIDKIFASNITVSFYSCVILYGSIKSSNIKYITINNCICNSIFLINQKNVNISYTESNIFPRIWKVFFDKIGVDKSNFSAFLQQKQSFYLNNCEKIIFETKEQESQKRGVFRDGKRIGYYLYPVQKALFNVNISIDFSDDIKDIETKIYSSYFNSLSLTGKSQGKVSIENTKISHFYVNDFLPENDVNFYNISPIKQSDEDSKIEFRKSNLDKIWFDNINFSDYSIVSFHRTKIGKSVYSSCKFPKDYLSFEKFVSFQNVHYTQPKSNSYYKDQFEIFLQLKQAVENTGNFYEAQKLQSVAYEALRKVNDISVWDKLILAVNSFSNNHGLSIKRAFCGLLVCSIILYIFYLLSLGKIFNQNDIDYNLIGYYFSFIDITHKIDFLVDKKDFNCYSLSIDFISKLMIGFYLFQFIAAFRKYGKSK